MFSKEQLLDRARQSPAAVARHDKAAWLSLFAKEAEVHDPVGSRAHRGAAALERFYETFIAPNQIQFHVEHDLVCTDTVVRDVVISTRMGNTGLNVDVPLFIRYEFVDESGTAKIHRLYAHWELAPMMSAGVFAHGFWRGCTAMLSLSRNMLKHQGLGGALGFSRAFVGLGPSAKAHCEKILEQLSHGESHPALPKAKILWANSVVTLDELRQNMRSCQWEKVLAGGRFVTARLLHADWRGVVVFELPTNDTDISVLRIFPDNA